MNWEAPKVYAVKHDDEKIRIKSRSGGIFTALSDAVLKAGGVVYGCVLTEKFDAVHTRADNYKARDKMRGSKYIQSNLGNTFKNVQEDLKNGKEVLFSGTSCQVAGLKSFLGKSYNNLLSIDIVCHGVPSPLVWQKYLKWQEERKKKKVIGVDFRNKKDFGWRAHTETFFMEDGSKVHSEVFKVLFYGHIILRPSCFECPYKSVMHPSDITIADYWGIEKAAPEFDDDRGVSLVLINNNKGEKKFSSIKSQIKYKATKIEDSLQPPLESAFPEPENREQFWEDFNKKDFSDIAVTYGGFNFKNYCKRKLRTIIRKTQRLFK